MAVFFILLALLFLSIHNDFLKNVNGTKLDESVNEKQMDAMKLDFVSMAAHELRTPLTAIRGYTSLLQMQSIKNMDPTGKELMSRLVISSENLSNLIDNLLEVTRIKQNRISLHKRPT